MASFLRKAARMNLVAMDFVLQVTVVELVLGSLDGGRTLSFELSRRTKTSGLPPKLVSTTRSEWGQTMQVVITLFLDKRSGRFQDKEYKLRLVQAEKGHAIIMAPALATFTLDASLYAHLGAGPSVEQPVDLYAPKLNGPGGFATVHLRVRCCETGGGRTPLRGRSVSVPNVNSSSAPLQTRLSPRSSRAATNRPGMPLPLTSSSVGPGGLLVGSSFGFSMSGSESRYSNVSSGSSAYSTPILRRPARHRPWSNEDDVAGFTASMRSRSSMRGSLQSKVGSKSFNDLDDSGHNSIASSKPGGPHHRTLRSSLSFGGMLESMGGSSSGTGVGVGTHQSPGEQLALSGRRAAAAAAAAASAAVGSPGTGMLTSASPSSTSSSSMAAGRRSGSSGGTGSRVHSGDVGGVGGRGSSSGSCGEANSRNNVGVTGSGGSGGDGGGGRNRTGVQPGQGVAAATPAAVVPYDRTATVGYSRLLARFTKGPSPRPGRSRPPPPLADRFAVSAAASRELGSGSTTSTMGSQNNFGSSGGGGGGGGIGIGGGGFNTNNKRRVFGFKSNAARSAASAAAIAPAPSLRQLTKHPGGGADDGGSGGSGDGSGVGHGGGGAGGGSSSNNPTAPSSAFSSPPEALQQLLLPADPAGGATLTTVPTTTAAATDDEPRPPTAATVPRRKSPSLPLSSLLPLSSSTTEHGRGGGGGGGGSGAGDDGGRGVVSRCPQIDLPPAGGGSASSDSGVGRGQGGQSGRSFPWPRRKYSGESPSAAGGSTAVAALLPAGNAGSGVAGGNGNRSALPPPAAAEEAKKMVAGMEYKVLHLEAALMRSELDLCRAKTELISVRQEAHELRTAKDAEEKSRPTSTDIPALYHALEGSVVLLQIASEKMLHLERAIARHREILPDHVFEELRDCVTQDASLLSPIPGAHTLQPPQQQQQWRPREQPQRQGPQREFQRRRQQT